MAYLLQCNSSPTHGDVHPTFHTYLVSGYTSRTECQSKYVTMLDGGYDDLLHTGRILLYDNTHSGSYEL